MQKQQRRVKAALHESTRRPVASAQPDGLSGRLIKLQCMSCQTAIHSYTALTTVTDNENTSKRYTLNLKLREARNFDRSIKLGPSHLLNLYTKWRACDITTWENISLLHWTLTDYSSPSPSVCRITHAVSAVKPSVNSGWPFVSRSSITCMEQSASCCQRHAVTAVSVGV